MLRSGLDNFGSTWKDWSCCCFLLCHVFTKAVLHFNWQKHASSFVSRQIQYRLCCDFVSPWNIISRGSTIVHWAKTVVRGVYAPGPKGSYQYSMLLLTYPSESSYCELSWINICVWILMTAMTSSRPRLHTPDRYWVSKLMVFTQLVLADMPEILETFCMLGTNAWLL